MTASRHEPALSRREVVVLAARLVAGGVAVQLWSCTNGSKGSKSSERVRDVVLPASFSDVESMRVVGRRYLERHAEETLPALLAELRPERGLSALDAEIRREYASGDVVRVEGWVLARTEVRIYAVVALQG